MTLVGVSVESVVRKEGGDPGTYRQDYLAMLILVRLEPRREKLIVRR